MKIARRGSLSNHGISRISLENPSVSWSEQRESVILKKSHVRDFNTDSTHDYEIELSLHDIACLFSVVGDKGVFQSEEAIGNSLVGKLSSIIRIQNACVAKPEYGQPEKPPRIKLNAKNATSKYNP